MWIYIFKWFLCSLQIIDRRLSNVFIIPVGCRFVGAHWFQPCREYLGGTKIQKHHKLSQKQPWNSPVEDDYTIPILEESFNNTQVYDNHIPFFKKGFPEKKHMCCIKIAWRHIIFSWPFRNPGGVPHQPVFGSPSWGQGQQTKRRAGSLGFDPLYLADGKKSEFLTQVDLPKGPGTFLGKKGANKQQCGGCFWEAKKFKKTRWWFQILRVTAPTRCDRHDRWFQILFILSPIWGRFPFWLTFFRWFETTNQERGNFEGLQSGQ